MTRINSENQLAPQVAQKTSNGYVRFWVPGKPIGQGAIRHSKQGFGYHANGHDLKPWRDAVAIFARNAHVPLLEGAVWVEYRFVLLRPKSVTRKYPTVAPDLDHYVRALGDAMKGVAFVDDSQICDITTSKMYGANQGVEISVGALWTSL